MSDSEQCLNLLEQIVIQVQWAPPIETIHLPDESALIMQVVLKIYVYYNDKLFFGIFHNGFISTKSLVWMALYNMEHCTRLIIL